MRGPQPGYKVWMVREGEVRAAERSEVQLLVAARGEKKSARAHVVERFMPLISQVASAYRYVPGIDRRELVQEGVVGILRALERYDPDIGVPFRAYASWWVREAMQHVVSELSRPVVLSDRASRQLARVRNARRRLTCDHGHEPSTSELAKASGISVQQLHKLTAAEQSPRPLQHRVAEREAGTATLGELIADPRAEDAYDELTTRLTARDVPRLLDRLSERERVVIEARYGLCGDERSLRELGESLGLSAERVRQIEQGALGKMRDACSLVRADATSRAPHAQLSGRRGPASGGPRKSRRKPRRHASSTAAHAFIESASAL